MYIGCQCLQTSNIHLSDCNLFALPPFHGPDGFAAQYQQAAEQYEKLVRVAPKNNLSPELESQMKAARQAMLAAQRGMVMPIQKLPAPASAPLLSRQLPSARSATGFARSATRFDLRSLAESKAAISMSPAEQFEQGKRMIAEANADRISGADSPQNIREKIIMGCNFVKGSWTKGYVPNASQ